MFEDLAKNTPEISVGANYWFVRTDGGLLYEAFIATNSIAIGYSMVRLQFIRKLNADAEDAKEALKDELKKHYPPKEDDDGRVSDLSGLHASQILRFCREMKRGDVVVVPAEKTHRLGIGFIEDDAAFEEPLIYREGKFPEFNKRRKVRWIRGVDRAEINPNLFKLFNNQQTIVDATPYAHWIDALIYDFFKKGETFHYVLRVGAKEHIKAQSLFRACLDLFDLADEFAASENVETDSENIETRINLNSPGDVEFWKTGIEMVGLTALMVVFINGGGFEMNLGAGKKLSLKTEGLLHRLTEFLNERKRRALVEEVRKKLIVLKVKTPKDMLDLIKETKK